MAEEPRKHSGSQTLSLQMTPGHALGTMSTIIPVKNGGRPHVYITPDRPARFWYDNYSSSARRFRDIAAKAGPLW